jgi:glycosyltransferase involved in cell wall biosynthesis
MRDGKPLASIGMPVYNGEKFIRCALDALLAQDYENFELVISDNASTDSTWDICQEYAARDPRVRLHANERNLGMWANFQTVLDLARGPYFMWAASDDCWHPSFLSTLVDELEGHQEAGAAMSAVEVVDEEGLPVNSIRFTGKDSPNLKSHYRMFWAVVSPAKKKYNLYMCGLFRTELARRAFRVLPHATNIDRIFVGLLSLATRLRYADQPMYTRRVHGASATVANRRRKSSNTKAAGPLSESEEALKLGVVIWRSTIVPWYRKFYIPIGVMGLWVRMIRTRFYQSSLISKIAYYLHQHRRQSNAN